MPEDNHADNSISSFQDTHQSRALLTNTGLKLSWIYLYRAFGRPWFSDMDYIYYDSISNSVTNLVGLAFKCLIIIIGQRLFSSSHKFCLISATAHRWNLWKEGMLQSIVNHVPNNFNPNQFQKGESGYLQVLGHIKWKELTAAG